MKYVFLLLSTLVIFTVQGQVINAYAKATSQAGDMFTLSTFDQSNHTFIVGEYAIIMQMQDNVIGANTNNNASFGNLSAIDNAGVYEIRVISGINGNNTQGFSAATPTQITFTGVTGNYNFNANSSVQIITHRRMAALDYTSTADMAALPWDGDIGGVIAIEVPGIFTLNHNVSADLSGFRGAGPNAGGSAGCSGGSNYRVNTQANFANKGEGIYKNNTANYNAGMGKILNGGGGGNSHNGGGGAGGNYSAGGDGGPGWPTCNPSAGGLGGISLQAHINAGRVFMGGGGGAGEGNNNLATDGGNGGGIIIIKADELRTDACAGISITANGESIAFAGNDGGGGAGAGGTIAFDVNTWNVVPGCPLIIESNGGDGGSVNSGATHGGGGGGGQGAVSFNSNVPTNNISTSTNNGQGGCDNNSNPCNSQAGNGSGLDGDGIIGNINNPLPVKLLSFDAEKLTYNSALLTWVTATESNNNYFTIFKSRDGLNWEEIAEIEGAGNSSVELSYSHKDLKLSSGVTYYKLRQTDFDGKYSETPIKSVNNGLKGDFSLYPNPFNNEITFMSAEGINFIEVYNMKGQLVKSVNGNNQIDLTLDVEKLPKGVYYLQIYTKKEIIREKVVKH